MATVIKIWSYCVTCWDRTSQYFIRDEGKYEVYVCERCNREHKIAVR